MFQHHHETDPESAAFAERSGAARGWRRVWVRLRNRLQRRAANATDSGDAAASPAWSADPLALGIVFALVLTVGQRAIGFVRSLLFCRLLPPEELGQWSVIWSVLLLLAPLASLGLPGSFCRYSEHYLQRGQLATYLRRVATASGIATALLAGGMFLFPRTFSAWIFREPEHTGLVQVVAGAFVLIALFNALQSLLESLRQIRIVTWMRFVQGLSFAVIAPGLLLLGRPGTLAVVVGFGLSCLLGFLPVLGFLRKCPEVFRDSGDLLSHRTMWARVAPFAMWTWIANFLSNSYESVDRFMLLHLLGGNAAEAQGTLGQYHSALIIPQLLSGLAVMIAGIVLPYLTAHWERQEPVRAQHILRWTLKGMGVAFFLGNVAILGLAPALFGWVLQGRYDDGLAIMPLTMVYCYWLSLGTLAQTALWCTERVRWEAGIMILGLLANVGLNAWLIPHWGLTGAVMGTSAANALCLAGVLSINHALGWRCDRGLWVVALLPLLLLLGPGRALLCAVLVVYAIVRYEWVFDASEKRELDSMLQAIRSRWVARAQLASAESAVAG